MQASKDTIDRVLTLFAAAAAAVLPILVDTAVLTSALAADIGSGVAVLIAGYHGGAIAAGRITTAPADQLP